MLPGNTQAFMDSPVYARTNGYLKHWYFDIGARVKKGDLLAEIETPEIDQQLQQANADWDTAKANYQLAQTTAARWQYLLKSNSVSKQETDQAVANMAAQKATVDSKEYASPATGAAAVFRKRLCAFRRSDHGAQHRYRRADRCGFRWRRERAISFGGDRPACAYSFRFPKFIRARQNKGRRRCLAWTNILAALSGKNRAQCKYDRAQFPNAFGGSGCRQPHGQLLPGAYVSVHLKLPQQVRSVTIPANTLLFRREGLRAAVVRNGKAELVPLVIGRDYGATVEIVSGLQVEDDSFSIPPIRF